MHKHYNCPRSPRPSIFGDYLSVQNLSARRSMQWWWVRSGSMSSSIGCAGAIVALANSDAYRHQVPRVPPSTTSQHSRHSFACASTRTPLAPALRRKAGGIRSSAFHGLRLAKLTRRHGPTGPRQRKFTHPLCDQSSDRRPTLGPGQATKTSGPPPSSARSAA